MTQDEAHLEKRPHVLYRMYDDERRLLYVGISMNLGRRMDAHLQSKPWFCTVAYVAIDHFDTRTAALAAERRTIVSEKPLHNLAHSGTTGDPFRGAPRHVVKLDQLPNHRPDPAVRGSDAALALVASQLGATSQRHGPGLRPLPDIRLGDRVRHETFGVGSVVATRGAEEATQIQVIFGLPAGNKWLLLRYAPILKVTG